MPRPKKPWSKVVTESGVSVRIYERTAGSVLQRETRLEDGTKDRKSLGHRDRALAEQQARTMARQLAELRLAGVLGPVTLGQLVRLFTANRAPLLRPKRWRTIKGMLALFVAHLKDDFRVDDLSQDHVDSYLAVRRSGALKSPRHRTKREGVGDGTLQNEFYALAMLFRWAMGFKVDGRRLLAVDPLVGTTYPHEKNPRRPIATQARYTKTMKKADEADPRGRLRCMLAIARHTGRRVNAIVQLRASDVCLSRDAVIRALAAGGMDEGAAEHMPHGAIGWRAAHDKKGFEDLAPIPSALRPELEAYLRAHPVIGDAPLFPATRDATRSAGVVMADYWLKRAEHLAGLPHMTQGVWHPYRRLWASERRHLPDIDVSRAGGWRDTRALKASYQQSDAEARLRVIENVAESQAEGVSRPQSAAAGHTVDTPNSPSADAASA